MNDIINDILYKHKLIGKLLFKLELCADPQPLMTLIYTCQPSQDSSGNYRLAAGTSSFSSSVTYRHSVSTCILSISLPIWNCSIIDVTVLL